MSGRLATTLAGALLAGCSTATLTGEVRSTTGAPVSGARLSSPGCEAVSDDGGRFRVACPVGTRTFQVTHPAYLDTTWVVSGEGGLRDEPVGSVSLVGIPLGEGLWLAADGRLERLEPAPLRRTSKGSEQRWCMDDAGGSPVDLPARPARLLDNHAVDWRLYRLDDYGCAYRMRKSTGGAWIYEADRVLVAPSAERGPGRAWFELDLEPGDYALVEWYDGFLVPADTPDQFRGHWLRVSVADDAVVGDLQPDAPTLTPAE